MSSTSGSVPFTWMCLNISSAKPSFLARRYMISWSVFDSKSGSKTFSRHCSERFDAVADPTVRSEEHTSELQSLMRISYAVFCLKKKNQQHTSPTNTSNHRKSNH